MWYLCNTCVVGAICQLLADNSDNFKDIFDEFHKNDTLAKNVLSLRTKTC